VSHFLRLNAAHMRIEKSLRSGRGIPVPGRQPASG
jgi:hypothetical protein